MRKRNIITIAVCAVFLVAVVSAVLLRYERARQLRLKAQSAALMNHLDEEVALVRKTDPLYAVAEKRKDASNAVMQNARSKKAESWLRADLKNPKERQKYQELDETHTLLAAIEMLNDPSDRSLLHQFILNTPQPTFPQSQREDISKIPQREVTRIREALRRRFSNSDVLSLDDPARLWSILSTTASEIEPQVEAEAARLKKACGNWPAAVLQECTVVSEAYLKDRVYTYYVRNHIPVDSETTLQQHHLIEQAIHGKS